VVIFREKNIHVEQNKRNNLGLYISFHKICDIYQIIETWKDNQKCFWKVRLIHNLNVWNIFIFIQIFLLLYTFFFPLSFGCTKRFRHTFYAVLTTLNKHYWNSRYLYEYIIKTKYKHGYVKMIIKSDYKRTYINI
jgi:hypothetical protein